MRIYHLKSRRAALFGAVLLIILGAAILLAGCFRKEDSAASSIMLPTDTERIKFLESMGWAVDPTPIEILDLELPDPLSDTWSAYAQLQDSQGLPFSEYAGVTIQRYTYTVTNYPAIDKGVQANLYLCDDVLIGGDIIFTGQDGFQKDLNYPSVPAKQ